ncbi:hypothetical protein NQ314_014138, partial [Rhamnusium bicolor]
INEDDQPLQSTISEKAYLVVEKYQKYEEAEELISMLNMIAKKPKTLAERIKEADISMLINKIYKNDQDQKSWFQALLNTPIFRNNEAVKCVDVWAHLCDENDVTRLLNLSIQSNNAEAKKLAIKCASTLNLEKLILVSIRHFYENKFKNILNEDIEPQLMVIFNKVNEMTNIEDDFVKEISLLLLQNPKVVFAYLYNECLKNIFYTNCLRDTFSNIKEIAKIENIGADILKDVMLKNKPNSNNGGKIKIPVTEETRHVIEKLLNIMNNCRCKFLEFDNIKLQNVRFIVDIIKNVCEVNANCNFKGKIDI